jgi:cobalt-zinc-cadmium efflux system outer membrane protein
MTGLRESLTPARGGNPSRRVVVGFAVATLVLAGCATPKGHDRAGVSRGVETRFGTGFGITPCAAEVLVPRGLDEGRPLTEDQAVLLALWNNAAFHEALVELDLTRADLVQAGLLPNPEFVYFWPAHDKPFKYLIDFPIEALWLRPLRVKAAAAENERATARLTQAALDLIRDTRQAHSDLQLARDRVRVAERAVAVRERIAELAEIRQKAGEASALEVSTARIEALRATQDLTPVRYEVTVAQERLRNLTGLSGFSFALVPEVTPVEPLTDAPVEELVAEAVESRPDALAADHALRAAAERLRLARIGWVRLLGLLDATSGRVTGHEFGPALRMTVPIFNRNQGGIARAEAEREQFDRRRQTVHNQIVMDVRTAFARYKQSRTELEFLQLKTRPEVELALRRAEAAYKEGNATYLIVLETNRQLIDTYAREAQLHADLRRAWAELERATGRRLSPGDEGRAPEAPPGKQP